MKKRNYIIDFARLLFIFGIMLNHLNAIGNSGENYSIIMRFGYLGVEFFFVVSGYLMTAKAMNEKEENLGKATAKFVFKKIGIIYPYYISAFLTAFIAVQFFERSSLSIISSRLLKSIPMLMQLQMAGFDGYQLLGPTWYLSAMYLSMLVLYPFAVRFRDSNIYIYIFAPIICIACYGHLIQANGSFSAIEPLEGEFIYAGLYRAFAGISLGGICYGVAKKLSSLKLTSFARGCLTAIEIGLYAAAFLLMRTQYEYRTDFYVCLTAAVAVTISFSNTSYSGNIFKGEPMWMGKLASCLYLADSPARKIVLFLMPDASRDERIVPVLLGTLFLALFIWVMGEMLVKAVKKIRGSIEKMLLLET